VGTLMCWYMGNRLRNEKEDRLARQALWPSVTDSSGD
jgi:hypothetical protein